MVELCTCFLDYSALLPSRHGSLWLKKVKKTWIQRFLLSLTRKTHLSYRYNAVSMMSVLGTFVILFNCLIFNFGGISKTTVNIIMALNDRKFASMAIYHCR